MRASSPAEPTVPLNGASALGHAVAGTLFVMSATMTGVQDMVAAVTGGTGTLFLVHCGTLLMLTWTGAQVALVSEAIERRDGSLVLRAVPPRAVMRRVRERWWWRTPALLALHLALTGLGRL